MNGYGLWWITSDYIVFITNFRSFSAVVAARDLVIEKWGAELQMNFQILVRVPEQWVEHNIETIGKIYRLT